MSSPSPPPALQRTASVALNSADAGPTSSPPPPARVPESRIAAARAEIAAQNFPAERIRVHTFPDNPSVVLVQATHEQDPAVCESLLEFPYGEIDLEDAACAATNGRRPLPAPAEWRVRRDPQTLWTVIETNARDAWIVDADNPNGISWARVPCAEPHLGEGTVLCGQPVVCGTEPRGVATRGPDGTLNRYSCTRAVEEYRAAVNGWYRAETLGTVNVAFKCSESDGMVYCDAASSVCARPDATRLEADRARTLSAVHRELRNMLQSSSRDAAEVRTYIANTLPDMDVGCLGGDGSYLVQLVYPAVTDADGTIHVRVTPRQVDVLRSYCELPGISLRGETDLTGDGVPDWIVSTRVAGDGDLECATEVLSPAHRRPLGVPAGCLSDESHTTIGVGRVGTTSAVMRIHWDPTYGDGHVFEAWTLQGRRFVLLRGAELTALDARGVARANTHREVAEALEEIAPRWTAVSDPCSDATRAQWASAQRTLLTRDGVPPAETRVMIERLAGMTHCPARSAWASTFGESH